METKRYVMHCGHCDAVITYTEAHAKKTCNCPRCKGEIRPTLPGMWVIRINSLPAIITGIATVVLFIVLVINAIRSPGQIPLFMAFAAVLGNFLIALCIATISYVLVQIWRQHAQVEMTGINPVRDLQ